MSVWVTVNCFLCFLCNLPASLGQLRRFCTRAQVWVELMRTRTLSLDDLAEPKTVSVAWVQAASRQGELPEVRAAACWLGLPCEECSGCRLHIERSSCEVSSSLCLDVAQLCL